MFGRLSVQVGFSLGCCVCLVLTYAVFNNESPDEIKSAMAAPIDLATRKWISAALIEHPSAQKYRYDSFVAGSFPTSVSARTNQAARQRMLREGGTLESEQAVAAALKWLAEHQLADGSWSFDHRKGPCQGRCRDFGRLEDDQFAATGLALLAFLGSGNTHLKGKYKKNVHAGLFYLIGKMREDGAMIDGGTMYSHGLAATALCEAYSMTNDKETVGRPALKSINFISYAQDPAGGGWRYEPRTPGDTSVTGTQAMALLKAKKAYLHVDPKIFTGLNNFLNSVQSERGTRYRYTEARESPATTAIGLLCRMYLGWKHENEALRSGIAYLSELGPSDDDMYYNHYATQVLYHYGGDEWTKWNDKLREHLIKTQADEGHAQGSWNFRGGDGIEEGGRHLNTCLVALTLEVYYRHQRIYKPPPKDEEFEF